MDPLQDQLDKWFKQIGDRVPSTKESQTITAAGAAVLANNLRKVTPRSDHDDKKYEHLRDAVTFQDTDIGGHKNGNSVVGFGEKAYIARFLNDGTKKMPATHFVDNARKSSEAEIFAAEKATYDRLKGGGN
ncbi:HK97-gp10 family putative phage morphogenesis protein [Paucilactobacillus suebicus]|uniref:Phage head-tail joining protein n=1 Tax=Paucilactobacillus suebicus DSM 5007 = KCTC 3549 TaxID=1423807 RepID=A0A0R1W2P7_9LACO|nr:HK97-gp10 family putative phage morphogenesis protein [Paucilactobacillus suebicus]KRM09542.1 phage head-tail joining protein [Paucilactobacillus suebicus DSM 5007 = KCTC 3549]